MLFIKNPFGMDASEQNIEEQTLWGEDEDFGFPLYSKYIQKGLFSHKTTDDYTTLHKNKINLQMHYTFK